VSRPKIIIDKSRFPLVMHTMCEGYGREDLEHMFREYDVLLSGKDRYALVIHFPLSVQMLMAGHRKLIADWWIPRRERVAAMNVMYSIVLESPLLRGGLTALLWVIQPGNPHKMASSVAEGTVLAVEALMANGIALTPELSALSRASRKPPPRRESLF
jgi:hypothetical protein